MHGLWWDVGVEITDQDRREVAERRRAQPWFYYADGVLDPVTTRKVVAEFGKPVLLLAGEYDFGLPLRDAAEYGGPFEHAGLAVQPGAGRFPWLAQPCPPSHGCRI